MSGTRRNLPSPTWRGIVGQTTTRQERSVPRWRRDPTAPARWARLLKIAAIVLGLLLCVALLIWVSLWLWPPQPARWVLLGAGYEENLAIPHNVHGWEGLTGLAEVSTQATAGLWQPGPVWIGPRRLLTPAGWDRELGPFPEKTLVLVLSLHGGSDARGPYLLADGADPFADDFDAPGPGDHRLRLSRILERLKQLPAKKNKVVILDATQVAAQWPFGILNNDFAPALQRLNDAIAAVPNLVVLSASDAGQRSWTSDEWRQTAFLHYLIEGLRGAAVGESGRIHSLALYHYVRAEVERWARVNRRALQTPVLLPSGVEGERRARAIELALIAGESTAGSRPATLANREMPEGVAAEWARAAQLQARVPAPAVHAPQLWSRYLAALLRLEQLVRAGDRDTTTTDNWVTRLRGLERAIEQSRTLALPAAAENSLGMPALQGRTLALSEPNRRALGERFNDLWAAPGVAEAKKLWEATLAEAARDPAGDELVRLRMLDLLLDRAQAAPAVHLEKAHALLRDVLDPLTRRRPAEAHYLAMLDRDLPRPAPAPRGDADRRARALRVRRLAERAALGMGASDDGEIYPYSEHVVFWVRETIRQADQRRRQAEDLLFATEPRDWEESDAHFEAAEALYREAIGRADVVRAALAIRDRTLPLLPYYSQWAARRRRPDEALIAALEELWDRLHALITAIESPDATTSPEALAATAEGVRAGFDRLETRFLAEVDEIGTVDSPEAWCDGDDALQVPLLDPDRRIRLWSDLRRMGLRLLTAPRGRTKPVVTPEEARPAWAAELARRQGRMALAVLGRTWFDARGGDVPDNFTYVRHLLDTSEVARAGEQVGLRWRQRVAEVNRLVERGLKEKHDLARDDLRTADALTRQLDAPACLHLDAEPPQLYRRLLVRDVLLEQAERAFADHWYAENPEAEPYYRAAALADLGDAEALDPRRPPFRESLQDRRTRYTRPVALTLTGPPRYTATSEQEIELAYQLRVDRDTPPPPGFPIVWVETGEFLEPREPSAARRVVRELGPRPADPLRCRLACPLLARAEVEPPALPRVERTTLTVRGLYRGHRLARATALDLHPRPEIVTARHPLPLAGAIAVRATPELFQRYGESGGSVAIVLDCSGSMAAPDDAPPGAPSKYRDATRALGRLLQGIARGTRVSLWIFGENRGNGSAADAEASIEQLQKPTTWDPLNDPGQRRRLIAQVEALQPWNATPLVRAMLRAKNEDLAFAPPGYKTLIVITDGADNRFAHDAEYNKAKKAISDVLREQFFDTGIEINLVGFRLDQADKKEIRKQFQVIEELPTPGRITTVDESGALAAVLERSLQRRLLFWVERSNHAPIAGSERGLAVSRSGANERWFTPVLPGGYDVRVSIGDRLRQPVALEASDRLLLSLVETPRGVAFERTLYAADVPNVFGPVARRDWAAAVFQNQLVGGHALRLLVTLERRFDREERTIRLVKPREVWIELTPRIASGTPPPFAVRWGYQETQPAPAWLLNVPEWPGVPGTPNPATPVIQIWWDPDQAAEPAGILERGGDFQVDLAPPGGRTIRLKSSTIVLESVRIEEHLVETGAREGNQAPPRDTKTCLVVRLAHEPGQPVWVRPRGLLPDGSEHRYYTAAGKYTGIFWTVNADQARQFLTHIEVIALKDFKQDCERQRHVLTLDGLPPPEPGSHDPLNIPTVEPPLLAPIPTADLPSALPEQP